MENRVRQPLMLEQESVMLMDLAYSTRCRSVLCRASFSAVAATVSVSVSMSVSCRVSQLPMAFKVKSASSLHPLVVRVASTVSTPTVSAVSLQFTLQSTDCSLQHASAIV